ncbi:hypothetical protein phi18_192 [Bacillus phage phi18]|nr:hypothetical protein phi18_192 [Bacillus phage phi18]
MNKRDKRRRAAQLRKAEQSKHKKYHSLAEYKGVTEEEFDAYVKEHSLKERPMFADKVLYLDNEGVPKAYKWLPFYDQETSVETYYVYDGGDSFERSVRQHLKESVYWSREFNKDGKPMKLRGR